MVPRQRTTKSAFQSVLTREILVLRAYPHCENETHVLASLIMSVLGVKLKRGLCAYSNRNYFLKYTCDQPNH